MNNKKDIDEFVKINSKIWKKTKKGNYKECIFIDGMLAQVENIFKGACMAKVIEDIYKYDSIAILNKYRKDYISIYKSYNINYKILSIEIIKNIFYSLAPFFKALKLLINGINGKELINLKYKGIQVGDIIYDSVIRYNFNIYTIESFNFKNIKESYKIFFTIVKVMYIVEFANKEFQIHTPKYYLTTHLAYEYELFVRLAIRYKAEVISIPLAAYKVFKIKNKELKNFTPCYNDEFHKIVEKYLSEIKNESECIIQAEKYLKAKFCGDTKNKYTRFIYKNSKNSSKDKFFNLIKMDSNKKNAVIMCHILSDNVHSSIKMLYKDYYTWIEETLNFVSNITDVNWIIKPHPLKEWYGETKVIEDLVYKYNNNNLYIYPNNLKSEFISEIADVIITVQGTAGIEFSSKGIPVIITGEAFYSKFGFTIEPKTKEEYLELLKSINNINLLSDVQIRKAKMVLYCYNEIIENNSLDILECNLHRPFRSSKIHPETLSLKIINDYLKKYKVQNAEFIKELLEIL